MNRVFISYAHNKDSENDKDSNLARRLYNDLKDRGVTPWMDKYDLTPGQNWRIAITNAIKSCSFFIALLSSRSVYKNGFFQTELKKALDIKDELPDENIFLIPLRIDECEIPNEKLNSLHYGDLFSDYNQVLNSVINIVKAEKYHKTDITITNHLGMEFIYITPGTFMMGSPKNEPGRSDDEELCKINITQGFYIQNKVTTVGQWKIFVENTEYKSEAEIENGAYGWNGYQWERKKEYFWNNPGFQHTDSHPVTCVSWNDVNEFVNWLNNSSVDYRLYRLPTESEWEYACRAGADTAYSFGSSISELDEYGWYCNNSGNKTNPIGQKKANAWGLYDMHGNVLEWCSDLLFDCLGTANYSQQASGYKRIYVLRGGSWYFNPELLRCANRCGLPPNERDSIVGFRLILTVTNRLPPHHLHR